MLVVDTGVLLAAADDSDPDHDECAALLEDEPGPLVTTALVVAETGYLINRQLGPEAEAEFYRSIAAGDLQIETLTSDEWKEVADFIEQYADLPLGGTDASILVLAQRLGASRIGTIDHRHFRVVKVGDSPLELLP